MLTALSAQAPQASRRLGHAWLFLCAAIALHVADEAATGFLSVYNPTVLTLRDALPLLPLPVFGFREWLTGLIAAVSALAALSVFVFRGQAWTRWAACLLAALMLLNALGHTAATLLGRTVESVRFEGPMPGFYSSPLLVLASLHLLRQLRSSGPRSASCIARRPD